MPTSTYTPLANTTLSATATSVTFSSINTSLYRDLILVSTVSRPTTGFGTFYIRFNSDAGTNYNLVTLVGSGTAASSTSLTSDTGIYASYDVSSIKDTSQNPVVWNILDYSATDKHKSVLVKSNQSERGVAAVAGRWASTSAITAISLHYGPGFASGSTFALYGVAA